MKNTKTNQGFAPLLILLGIAIVAALGGGGYYAAKHYQSVKMTASVKGDVTATSSAHENNGMKTLRSLFSVNQNLTCTFSHVDEKQTSSGTVYISGTMMRGDFTTKIQSSNTIDSHILRVGDEVYAWSGTQGAKMSFEGFNATTTAQASANSNVDLDQKANYNCTPWTTDSSKFAVPSAIKFYDLNALMKGKIDINAALHGGR